MYSWNIYSICNPWMGVHPYKFHFNYIFTHPNTCTCLLLHDIITCLCLHMYIFYCVSVILVTCIPTPQWRMQDFRKGGSVPLRRREPHPLFVSRAMRARRSSWLMMRSCVHYYYARVIGALVLALIDLASRTQLQERQLRARLRRNLRNYVISCQKGGSIAPLDPSLDPPLHPTLVLCGRSQKWTFRNNTYPQ